MSDLSIVPPVPAPVPPAETTDNQTIRAMRAEIDAAKASAKEASDQKTALEARLTDIERKDMDAQTRLQAELEDAKRIVEEAARLRDDNGKYVSAFEKLYNDRLEQVPDNKKAQVASLSATGDWSARMTQLESAISLAGIANVPARAGTFTQPPGSPPPPPEAAKPLTPQEIQKTSLKSIIGGLRATQTKT